MKTETTVNSPAVSHSEQPTSREGMNWLFTPLKMSGVNTPFEFYFLHTKPCAVSQEEHLQRLRPPLVGKECAYAVPPDKFI